MTSPQVGFYFCINQKFNSIDEKFYILFKVWYIFYIHTYLSYYICIGLLFLLNIHKIVHLHINLYFIEIN